MVRLFGFLRYGTTRNSADRAQSYTLQEKEQYNTVLSLYPQVCSSGTLKSESGATVQRGDHPLQAGKYFINTAGFLIVNNEPWLVRTRSVGLFALEDSFRDALRERDHRCVITGLPAYHAKYGPWTGFTATPIFPLTHERHWVTHGDDKWITIPGSSGPITSVQNGMLLRSDISTLFESYILAINPDVSIISIFLGAPTTNNPLRTVTR